MGAEQPEVLRRLWQDQGNQDAGSLDEDCETKTCRRMSDAGVGFEEFAPGPTEADRSAAWRDRLKREGKYNADGGTLRDLILGR